MDDDEWVNQGYYCTLCQVETTCMANFRDHLNGKSHKSTVMKVKALMKNEKEEMPDIMQWYTREDIEEYKQYGVTREMLQEASIDSSEYEQALDPDQIGKTTADPDYFCKLCQVQTTSLGNFRDHLNGKGHKNNMTKFKDGGVLPFPKTKKAPGTLPPGAKPESVILEQVKNLRQPVLGLDFITEFHTVGRIVCVCNCCAAKFDSNAAVSHTTGRKHRLHYLKEKQPAHYDHAKRYGGKKAQLAQFLEEILPEIERTDGRGAPIIKIYENEDLKPGSLGEFNEEERKRQLKVSKIGSSLKMDYDDWINNAVNRAAATRKDDDLDATFDYEKKTSDPVQPIVKKDDKLDFLDKLLQNNEIGNANSRQSPPHRRQSPSYMRQSPPYRRQPSPYRRQSPPYRRQPSPNYRRHSPPYGRPIDPRGRSPPYMGQPSSYHHRGYDRPSHHPQGDYVRQGPDHPPPFYDPYSRDPYGYSRPVESSRYISLPSGYIEPDPIKRAALRQPDTHERYIVPPQSDIDPDPLKRVGRSRDKESIDYSHEKKKRGDSPRRKRKADEFEEDLRDILGTGKGEKSGSSLSLLNSYGSPERSPPSKRQVSNKVALPFEKSYLQREMDKKRKLKKKSRRSSSSSSSSSSGGSRSTSRSSRSRTHRKTYDVISPPRKPLRRPASPFRPRRRSPSPRRRSPSPRRRAPSPSRRPPSPKRRLPSPKREIISPPKRNPSPKRRAPSPPTIPQKRPAVPQKKLKDRPHKGPDSSPGSSRPGTLRPDVSRPDVSRPDMSRPDVSRPDISRPETTVTSKPGTSKPGTSKPDLKAILQAGDEDAQADAIANILLEMGNSASDLDPTEALQQLLSTPELAGLLTEVQNDNDKSKEKKAKETKSSNKKGSRNPVAFGFSTDSTKTSSDGQRTYRPMKTRPMAFNEDTDND